MQDYDELTNEELLARDQYYTIREAIAETQEGDQKLSPRGIASAIIDSLSFFEIENLASEINLLVSQRRKAEMRAAESNDYFKVKPTVKHLAI